MNRTRALPLTLGLAAGLIFFFQNCGNVKFNPSADPTSSQSSVAADGGATMNEPQHTGALDHPAHSDDRPGGCKDKKPDSKDHAHGRSRSREFVICSVLDGHSHGKSNRIGLDADDALTISTAMTQDVCVSRDACLTTINKFLNGSKEPDASNSPLAIYTIVEENGVCGHNPNVRTLRDDEVQARLDAHGLTKARF